VAELVRFASDEAPGATLAVVSGRRRRGKTFLLDAVCEALHGFYFGGIEATGSESLRLLGARLGEHLKLGTAVTLPSWDVAADALLRLGMDRPLPVVIDEFPYLARAAPSLPSILQQALGPRRPLRLESRTRLILCGSAISFMGRLLGGTAPLRGRASLELVVPALDYRLAAMFWGITDPRLALLTHAIVGGTPAYRREYARHDSPKSLADFDGWVARTALNPASPLFREARYLLAEEPDLRDTSVYHSILAAAAAGNGTRARIAAYVSRKATDVSHHLSLLEDVGLLRREPDAFRANRSVYRVAEPLVAFYAAIIRPEWSRLELGRAAQVWAESQERFHSSIVGPHFEGVCRRWAAAFAAATTFGSLPRHVAAGTVSDPRERQSVEIDVVVFGKDNGRRRQLLSIGEAKWGEVMGLPHLARLQRARALLADRDNLDASSAIPACYSAAGFTDDLKRAARAGEAVLVDLERLYGGD
jgi:uncharacterized protein